GGAAHGSVALLLFGLALSVPILLLGSELVARLLGRYPLFVYVGVIVLILTAAEMILGDTLIHERYDGGWTAILVVSLLLSVIIIGLGRWNQRDRGATGDLGPGAAPRQVPRPPAGAPSDS
ncbi:MAG: TerC family protein, partial [Chloroflexota bacterium]|nr:TerC family protein [Chloroflexota bacterium]